MYPTKLHFVIFLILYWGNATHSAKYNCVSKFQILSKFDNLVSKLSHCSYVSIRALQKPTCETKHTESPCNIFIKNVQQKYGSSVYNFQTKHALSLYTTKVRELSIAKRWFSQCIVWIQYKMISIPENFTRFNPDVFIFYLDLTKLNKREVKNAAVYLRTTEMRFSKLMTMIQVDPKSSKIKVI